VPRHSSPSQFKTFSLCRRKWYIDKCTNQPRPPDSAAQTTGKNVHAWLEAYVAGMPLPEITPNHSAIANKLTPYVEDLKRDYIEGNISLEHRIDLADIALPMMGYIDVFDCRKLILPSVDDYKTSSDIMKWGSTEESLRTDVQMVPYALYACRFTESDRCRVRHLQTQTRGRLQARKVSVVLDRSDLEKQWENYFQPTALEMVGLSRATGIEETEPNWTACSAFGGCQFSPICQALRKTASPKTSAFAGLPTGDTVADLRLLIAKQAVTKHGANPPATAHEADQIARLLVDDYPKDTWKDEAPGLLALLREAEDVDGAETPEPPAEEPPSAEPVEHARAEGINPPKGGTLLEQLKAKQAAAAEAPAVDDPVVTPPADEPQAAPPAERVEEPIKQASRRTDTEYKLCADALVSLCQSSDVENLSPSKSSKACREVLNLARLSKAHIEEVCILSDGRLLYVKGGGVLLSVNARGTPDAEGPAAGESEPNVLATAVKKATEGAAATIVEKVKAAVEEVNVIVDEDEPPVSSFFGTANVLYIDCAPVKPRSGPVTFEDLIAPLVVKVAKANKVVDPLLLDYNNGLKEVAALLRVEGMRGSVLVANTNNPYWVYCSQYLTSVAAVVVKG